MRDEAWIRAPRQARSQETLERFLVAAQALLDEDRSFEEITVADIVRRADRTVGSFYARFEDKDAVLHVLVDRLDERLRKIVHAFCDPVRWDGVPVEDFVSESVRLNVEAYRRSGPLFHAALTASARDPAFRDRRLETMRFCAEEQKRFLRARAAEIPRADLDRASDQMFELVATTLDHELLFGRFTTTSPSSDSDLARELTQRCLVLLGIASSPAAATSAKAPPARTLAD